MITNVCFTINSIAFCCDFINQIFERYGRFIEQQEAALSYVRTEFQRRCGLQRLTPLGFNNAYALLMRRQPTQRRGIATSSELGSYLRW